MMARKSNEEPHAEVHKLKNGKIDEDRPSLGAGASRRLAWPAFQSVVALTRQNSLLTTQAVGEGTRSPKRLGISLPLLRGFFFEELFVFAIRPFLP